MRKSLSMIIAVSILVATLMPFSLPAKAASASVTDHVYCGNTTDENNHSIITLGNTGATSDTAKVGTISEVYNARYVYNSGNYFQYTFAINNGSPLTIQIREVRPQPHWGLNYGYEVYLNNTLVYTKDSNVPCSGSGPYVSTFIDCGDPSIINNSSCTLKIVSKSSNPAYFTDIYVYSDFRTYVGNKGIAGDKMTVIPLVGNDSEGTTALQTKISNDLPGIHTNSNVNKGFAVIYNFLAMGTNGEQQASQAQMGSVLNNLINLAENNSLPIQIKFNTEWAGTPKNCDDGSGGKFGDIKYNQILWSDNDQYNDPGLSSYLGAKYNVKYGLSTPNVWGNTPWLSYNNPVLKTFITNQFSKAMTELNYKVWLEQSRGHNYLLPLTNSSEVIYWARVNGNGVEDSAYKNNVNGGVERYNLWGDFNNDTVAAAAADGITLDPTNGLDYNTEKEWLHKNLAKHAEKLVNDIYSKLERERIQANNGVLTYPADMLRNKIFTESYAAKFFPLFNDTRPLMETGIVNKANPGVEYFIPTQLSHLIKLREFGRIANPNFETTGTRDAAERVAVLRQIFAMGGDHVTLYNYSSDMNSYVNSFADNMVSYDSTGSSQNYTSALGIGPASAVDRIGQTFTVGCDNQMINEIGLKVQKVGDTSNVKLNVALYDSPAKTKLYTMRVMSSSELPTGYNWANIYVPIVAKDRNSSCYIEITQPGMTAGNYYALLGNNSNNYSGGQYYYNGTANANVDMVFRTGVDLLRERERSQVVSYRREARETIDRITGEKQSGDIYAQAYIDQANNAYMSNDYKAAYQLANKADSHRYPVLYQVTGSSASMLNPFPMSINPQGKAADISVTSYDTANNRLFHSFSVYSAGNVTLTYTGAMASKTIYINGVAKGTGSIVFNAAANTAYSVEVR